MIQDWLAAKTESEFQRELLEAAGYLGYLRFHDHDARRDNERSGVDRGFPDSLLIRPDTGRLIVAELKTERGRLSADQRRWLEAFRAVRTVEAYVWRPRNWDEAIRVLRGERAMGE